VTIRTAVIGVGSMGKNHARVYSELMDTTLVGVADADETTANAVGKALRVNTYTDYHEMLEKERPEAVSIAVPTSLHLEVATACLETGAHILVEKPIAANLEEAEELIKRAKAAQRKLMIGHIVRFNPAIQALKEKLDNGYLGRIYQIFCRRTGPHPKRILDVGVVIDLAPHDIDTMRFLTGMEPLRVYSETENYANSSHEDSLLGTLKFPEGITAGLEVNWLTPIKVREVCVLGEQGLFRVDDLTQDLFFYENPDTSGEPWSLLKTLRGASDGTMIRFSIQRYEPLKAELQSFIDAILQDTDVPITGEDGLAALRLALALIESGQKHTVIEV